MLKALGLGRGITIKIIPKIERMPRKRVIYKADPNKAKQTVRKQYNNNPEPQKATSHDQYRTHSEMRKEDARKQYKTNPVCLRRIQGKLFSPFCGVNVRDSMGNGIDFAETK